jgi:beta-lactamase regulating signal transducer with metallopeptidase domain
MSSTLDAVATTLLTYASHSAAACFVALLAARLLRRPQDRELLWKAALIAPLLTTTVVTASSMLGAQGGFVDLGLLVRRTVPLSLPDREVMMRIIDDGRGQNVFRQVTDPVTTTLSILATAVAAVCSLIALVRLTYRRRMLRRVLAPRQISNESLQLENGRRARLSTAIDLPSPVALGTDEVCLPTEVVEEFAPEHRRALIAHEVAHLGRRDPFWFLVVEVIGALSAFQPLIFPVIRAFRRDVELICDEAAVTVTRDAPALIGALALLASPFDPRSPLHGAATAHDGSPLVARAERIAKLAPDVGAPNRRMAAMLAVAALIGVLCAVPAVSSAPRASDFPLHPIAGMRAVHAQSRLVVIRGPRGATP